MTSQIATLIAAGLAAFVSVLNLFLSANNKKKEEFRSAIRLAAAKDLDEVGRLIHEVIALSFNQAKSNTKTSHESRRSKSRAAANKLKDKRLDVRYSLWGIEEGLRTLTRLPDWIAHTRADEIRRNKLLRSARKLGAILDSTIRQTYLSGASPGFCARWRVKREAKKIRDLFADFPETDE